MDDEDALRAFVVLEHPRLVGALVLYTGEPDLGEELAAEALARVARDWGRVRAMAAPGAYAHRVGINLANSRFRRRAAARRARARIGPVARHHADPDVATVLAVREAVAALPPAQRAAVVLHHLRDLDTAEVAAVLGVRPGTVRSNLHDARRALRAVLDDDLMTTALGGDADG